MPAGVTLEEVKEAAGARNRGRFPTLSYIHKYSGNVLWRAAELRADVTQNGNEGLQSDVKMLGSILGGSEKLFVFISRENSRSEDK